MVAGHADDRAVGREVEKLRVQLLDRPLLDAGVLRVAGLVCRLQVDEDEGVAGFEPFVREREAAAQVGRMVGRLRRGDRVEADRGGETAEERGLGDERPVQAVPFGRRTGRLSRGPTT